MRGVLVAYLLCGLLWALLNLLGSVFRLGLRSRHMLTPIFVGGLLLGGLLWLPIACAYLLSARLRARIDVAGERAETLGEDMDRVEQRRRREGAPQIGLCSHCGWTGAVTREMTACPRCGRDD